MKRHTQEFILAAMLAMTPLAPAPAAHAAPSMGNNCGPGSKAVNNIAAALYAAFKKDVTNSNTNFVGGAVNINNLNADCSGNPKPLNPSGAICTITYPTDNGIPPAERTTGKLDSWASRKVLVNVSGPGGYTCWVVGCIGGSWASGSQDAITTALENLIENGGPVP